MGSLTVIVPQPLAGKLREHKVADEKINQTVADALWKLVEEPSIPPRLPQETNNEYFRRIMLEMRGDVPPSLDDPLVEGMTLGQYLALSEEERDALWDKWEEEEWVKIEKQYARGIDVKLETRAPRQERRPQVARRIGESRERYQTKRKRTKRA